MKITDVSEKELIIAKSDYNQLCDLISQIESCAGKLVNAAKSAKEFCFDIKIKKIKHPEETN